MQAALVLLAVAGSTAWLAVDASKRDWTDNSFGRNVPSWVIGSLLLWPLIFPMYVFVHRKKAPLKAAPEAKPEPAAAMAGSGPSELYGPSVDDVEIEPEPRSSSRWSSPCSSRSPTPSSRLEPEPFVYVEPEPEPVVDVEPEPFVEVEPEPAAAFEPALTPEPDPVAEFEPMVETSRAGRRDHGADGRIGRARCRGAGFGACSGAGAKADAGDLAPPRTAYGGGAAGSLRRCLQGHQAGRLRWHGRSNDEAAPVASSRPSRSEPEPTPEPEPGRAGACLRSELPPGKRSRHRAGDRARDGDDGGDARRRRARRRGDQAQEARLPSPEPGAQAPQLRQEEGRSSRPSRSGASSCRRSRCRRTSRAS